MEIRSLTSHEVCTLATGFALQEGWNPGLYDGHCFFMADREGFLGGFIEGDPVGCISAVCYPEQFAFLGLYIVRHHFRGKGYGMQLWEKAMQRMGGCNIGLDGVVAQQDNYRKSGFRYAHRNIRYAMENPGADMPENCRNLQEGDLPELYTFDRMFFPSARNTFIRNWVQQPGAISLGVFKSGVLTAYAVARPCYRGYKVGPLFALDFEAATKTFEALLSKLPKNVPCFLDVPEPNKQALKLVARFKMKPEFETARMYTGEIPKINMDGIYGITTFELG